MSGGRITYEEALASLKAMFPALDMGVIETVSRTCGSAGNSVFSRAKVVLTD